jgi:hypothetical protein
MIRILLFIIIGVPRRGTEGIKIDDTVFYLRYRIINLMLPFYIYKIK